MGFRHLQPEVWQGPCLYDADDGGPSHPADGWFCRLTAPGYLDCTEESGPFDTREEAARELVRMYGPEFDVDVDDDDAMAWYEWAKDEGVADEFGDAFVESFEAALADE